MTRGVTVRIPSMFHTLSRKKNCFVMIVRLMREMEKTKCEGLYAWYILVQTLERKESNPKSLGFALGLDHVDPKS